MLLDILTFFISLFLCIENTIPLPASPPPLPPPSPYSSFILYLLYPLSPLLYPLSFLLPSLYPPPDPPPSISLFSLPTLRSFRRGDILNNSRVVVGIDAVISDSASLSLLVRKGEGMEKIDRQEKEVMGGG